MLQPIPSDFSRWRFSFDLPAAKTSASEGARLKLKLHRLKPDGIFGGHPIEARGLSVRLKLKLHRLKPDGIFGVHPIEARGLSLG